MLQCFLKKYLFINSSFIRGGGDFRPPPPVFCIFLEKPPLQPIMKPICKFLLDPRDEPQTLIIPKKYDLVAL